MAFDVIDWMNAYRHHDLYIYPDAVKPVQDFVLIWSLFERVVCGRFADVDKIKKAVETVDRRGRLAVDRYDEFLTYFRHRYTPDDGDYENLWKGLSPTNHNKDAKPLVFGTIKGSISGKDNVKGLLLIAYRIRNNLFHGHKETRTLNAQSELFVVINQLIAVFIEQYDIATLD